MINTAFYVISFLTIVSALFVIFLKNPVYNVISLVITFFCIACHYMLLGAQFLAVSHVIVYAGAIMVLLLYVIMMLNLNTSDLKSKPPMWRIIGTISGGVLAVVFFATLRILDSQSAPMQGTSDLGTVKMLGKVLLNEYLFPFEAVSILLIATMLGVVMLGRSNETIS